MIQTPIRILLVEDDPVDCMAVERLVRQEQLPYEITRAPTIAEAVARLRDGQFDLALVDFILPDGNGLNFLNQAGKLACIFLTAINTAAVAAEIMKAGAYDYIVKDRLREYLKLLPTVVQKTLERKQANDQIELQQEIIAGMSEIVVVLDEKGLVVFANRAIKTMLGFSPEELVGKPWGEQIIAGAHQRQELQARISSGAKGETRLAQDMQHDQYDLNLQRRDGQFIWTAWSETCRPQGGLLLVGRDIAERKQVEHQARERTKELQAFYSLAEITEREGITLDELYQECMNILPKSWQYPQIACARIVIGDSDLRTENFTESAWMLSAPIKLYGSVAGKLNVGYLDEMLEADEGPFLKEERLLIDAIAERLGRITERKQAEEALRETNTYLDNLINYANAPIIVWDAQFRITRFNHAFEVLTGRNQTEVIGQSLEILFPPALADNSMALIRKTLAGERWETVEINILHRDESVWTVLWNSATLYALDGQTPIATIAQGQNITERKQAEKALEQLNRYNRTLIETSIDPLMTIGPDGRITDVNAATEVATGYMRSALIGTDFSTYFTEPQKAIDVYLQVFEQGTVFDYPLELKHRDGNVRSVLYNASIFRDEDRQVSGVVAAARDITERKKNIDALRSRTEELETLVKLTSNLRIAKNREELLSILIEEMRVILKADVGTFFENIEGGRIENSTNQYPREWQQISLDERISPETEFLGKVINPGVPLYCSDPLEPANLPSNDSLSGFLKGAAAYGIIPIKSVAANIGLLLFTFTTRHEFSEQEKRLLNAITEMAENALTRVELMETLEQRVKDRRRELSAIYRINAIGSEALEINPVLDRSLEEVIKTINGLAGNIRLVDDAEKKPVQVSAVVFSDEKVRIDFANISETLSEGVVESGETLIISDHTKDPRFYPMNTKYTIISVPIKVRGRPIGALNILREISKQFNPEEVSLLASITDALGIMIENMRLLRLAQETAVVKERERLSRELHDSVTQSLYSLTLFAETGSDLINNRKYQGAQNRFTRIKETAQQALKEMRLLIYQLRPLALEQDGLVEAIRRRLDTVEKRSGIEAFLVGKPSVKLPPSIEECLYHIALEALNNALKHSSARSVVIRIKDELEKVELAVEDDGIGFDLERVENKGGMGINGMRERTKQIGGRFSIMTTPGKGARVSVTVDIPADAVGVSAASLL